MKGIVFTEFIEFAEGVFDVATVEHAIRDAAPTSDGAYTAVGSYPAEELIALLESLDRATRTAASELLVEFGRHLFARFAVLYPSLCSTANDTLSFLERVEDTIHVEVHKLYADAEFPTFATEVREPDRLVLRYGSSRALADLAVGLIEGCARHFGQRVEVGVKEVRPNDRTDVRIEVRILRFA